MSIIIESCYFHLCNGASTKERKRTKTLRTALPQNAMAAPSTQRSGDTSRGHSCAGAFTS